MNLLEKSQRKSSSRRAAAVVKYRQLIARFHAPRDGDEDALADALDAMGVGSEAVTADLNAIAALAQAEAAAKAADAELSAVLKAAESARKTLDDITNPLRDEAREAGAAVADLRQRLAVLGERMKSGKGAAAGVGVDDLIEQLAEAEYRESRSELLLNFELRSLHAHRADAAEAKLRDAQSRTYESHRAVTAIKIDAKNWRVFGQASA